MSTLSVKFILIQSLLWIMVLFNPYSGFTQISINEVTIVQQIESTDKLLQSPLLLEANNLFVQQIGKINQISIQQTNTSKSMIQQYGFANDIYFSQSISDGILNAKQFGNSNMFMGASFGNDIETSILQKGVNNKISQFLMGNNLMFEIRQEGGYNEMIHEVNGSFIPMKIFQRGNDMRLIIKTN